MRIFGCPAYAHVLAEKCHKLDARAEKVIFTGYGDRFGVKAYRLYNPHTQKFSFSRSAFFHELALLPATSTSSEPELATVDPLSPQLTHIYGNGLTQDDFLDIIHFTINSAQNPPPSVNPAPPLPQAGTSPQPVPLLTPQQPVASGIGRRPPTSRRQASMGRRLSFMQQQRWRPSTTILQRSPPSPGRGTRIDAPRNTGHLTRLNYSPTSTRPNAPRGRMQLVEPPQRTAESSNTVSYSRTHPDRPHHRPFCMATFLIKPLSLLRPWGDCMEAAINHLAVLKHPTLRSPHPFMVVSVLFHPLLNPMSRRHALCQTFLAMPML